ncbi:MAG: 50S ribosomal protein L29 [bacterium]|nr:50S ribosomal protein L29 [bacterium]
MKYSELQNKGAEELNKMLEELKIKLGEMKFQVASNALKNTNEMGAVKKDIARILTIMQQTE